jgi:hypothetical protein
VVGLYVRQKSPGQVVRVSVVTDRAELLGIEGDTVDFSVVVDVAAHPVYPGEVLRALVDGVGDVLVCVVLRRPHAAP